MKVYIVTKGCYSDYHIVGVYSNKKIAEQVAFERQGHYSMEETNIEEYEVDKVKPLGVDIPQWSLLMYKDGNSHHGVLREPIEEEHVYFYFRRQHSFSFDDPNGRYLSMSKRAKESDTIVKIANEKRGMLIAQGIWDMPEEEIVEMFGVPENENYIDLGFYVGVG